MRLRTLLSLVLLLPIFIPSTARAGHVSLGANLGFARYNPDFGDGTTIIGWPSSELTYMPGIRVGLSDEAYRNEIYFDTGFTLLDSNASASVLELTGNYQLAFTPAKEVSPYVTAGGGIITAHTSGGFSESSTGGVIGGGLGFRDRLANGHGALRFEGRFDHLFRADPLLEKANLVQLRLGFDLYLQ